MQTLPPTRKAGRFRQALFRAAVIPALAFVPLVLCDLSGHPVLTTKFSRLSWPLVPVVPLAMIFICADLVGELHSMMMPAERNWNDGDHFYFVGMLSFFLVFGLAIFYLIAVGHYVEPVVGSPG